MVRNSYYPHTNCFDYEYLICPHDIDTLILSKEEKFAIPHRNSIKSSRSPTHVFDTVSLDSAQCRSGNASARAVDPVRSWPVAAVRVEQIILALSLLMST